MSFMRNFYFLSCHLFHHHFPFSDTFWMGGTMSQGLKGIQSVSERHSVPD